jgi:hypothetical protein
MAFIFLGLTCATQATAASQPKKYSLDIQVTYPQPHTEQSEAWAVALGKDYKVDVAYIGEGVGAPGLSDLANASLNRNATIINAGFSVGTPGTPDGLLLVRGRIVSPMTLQHDDNNGPYHLNTVLCVNSAGKMSFIPTGDFKPNIPTKDFTLSPQDVIVRCQSAVQTTPRILLAGKNQISNQEPISSGSRRKRTVIGFALDGTPYAVIFSMPISRYFIGEFLRKPPDKSAKAVPSTTPVRITGKFPAFQVSEGLGLTDAVGLSSDENSAIIVEQKHVTGNPYRQIPSALIFH